MTSLIERGKIMALIMEAMAAGARQNCGCAAISLNKRTLQRWQSGKSTGDARPLRAQLPKNQLSFLERKHLLTIANSDEFGQLPPSQIVSQASRLRAIHCFRINFLSRTENGKSAQAAQSGTTGKTASQAARAIGNGTQSVGQLGYYLPAHAGIGSLFLPVFVHRYF